MGEEGCIDKSLIRVSFIEGLVGILKWQHLGQISNDFDKVGVSWKGILFFKQQ